MGVLGFVMKISSTRNSLKKASKAVQQGIESAEPEVARRLSGIAEQLEYYIEGDPSNPEAHASPQPGTLDTIQSNISDIIDTCEDQHVSSHLTEARKHLILTIVTLDNRRRKQYESFLEGEMQG